MSKAFALFTTGLEVYAFYLIIGKLITSITMQFFMFFFTMFIELGVELKELWSKTSVYVHSFLRIIICLCPKNNWATNKSQLI